MPDSWTFRRVMWATLVLAFVALSFWLLFRFYNVVFTLFIAIVLGTVIRPVVSWLHGRGLPRPAASILVYLLVLALLTGFVLLLFPLLVEQGTTIAAAVPGYLQNVREWMVSSPNRFIVRLGEFLPVTMPGLPPVPQTRQQMLVLAGQAVGYLGSAAKTIFMATAFLLLAFHWTLDGPRTIRSWLLLVPKGRRESIIELISEIETKISFYVAGRGVLCLTIGIMALVAYLLIGLPNVLVLALVAGVFEAVPMIGPVLGAIPAAVIAFSIAPSKLIWVIVATLISQQVENNILVPRVMRKSVGVNPFVSLLALLAFSSLFGIAGALMAIPIAAIIQLLLDRFVFHPAALGRDTSPGRDYASRLRYEAQALTHDLRKQARFKQAGSDLRVKQIDQVMDEIEVITTDLDALLAQVPPSGAPSGQRKRARGIWRTMEPDIGAYIRSQGLHSLLAGLLLGLGYWLLGSPYPALLGLAGALACLVPVVGAALAVILTLLMGLLTSAKLSIVTVLYALAVLVPLGVWVKPRLFNRSWDNHILTVVLLIALGDAFGLVGIIVAPLLSVVCQILWSRLVTHRAVSGAAAQVSDLIERQEHVWDIIRAMDEPPIPLLTSSMERLTSLIAKAEPILQGALPDEPSEPSLPVLGQRMRPNESNS